MLLFDNNYDTLTTYRDLIQYDYAGSMPTKGRVQSLYKLEAASATDELYLDRHVGYDQHRFVTQIRNDTVYGSTTLRSMAKFTYERDKVGNPLSKQGYRGGSPSYDGYNMIAKLPSMLYDERHRITSAGYDAAGVTQHEDFDYDSLGNRVTYWDERNAVTTAYTNNLANEYTTIEDVPGGGGAVNVYYDAAGNLSRDEFDFEYTYDWDNRLTKVTYERGGGSTQVARFEYDALGRMISSQIQYDRETAGMTETLKYYYDGPNVLAEYDPSDHLSRRYVHGTGFVDERAVLLAGDPDNYYVDPQTEEVTPGMDSYYYLLEDLHTVTGLLHKNGQLAEAYSYGAYGDVSILSYHMHDVDRSGEIKKLDVDLVNTERLAEPVNGPTSDPVLDIDFDGDCDGNDYLRVLACKRPVDPVRAKGGYGVAMARGW